MANKKVYQQNRLVILLAVTLVVIAGIFYLRHRQPTADNRSKEISAAGSEAPIISSEEAKSLVSTCKVDWLIETHHGFLSVSLKDGGAKKVVNYQRNEFEAVARIAESNCGSVVQYGIE